MVPITHSKNCKFLSLRGAATVTRSKGALTIESAWRSVNKHPGILKLRLVSDFYLSISHYSTTSTSSAAYIIGGYLNSNIIAQFKHGQWSKVGDLSTGRYGHGSITDGVKTIIIGGNVSG